MLEDLDTVGPALDRYTQLIRSQSKPDRLRRAFNLSAMVRAFSWQGAVRHAGHLGEAAVVERFLMQLYGPETGARLVRMIRHDGQRRLP